MSTFMSGADLFEGVRTFPREPEQLLHHLSRVNHSLQTRYFITAEIAEFALQPDKAADFQKFYIKEVQQIIAHMNRATGSNIKVRVDGTRIARGLEIVRVGNGKSGGAHSAADGLADGDGAWQASMTATSRKLAEQELVERQCMLAVAAGAAEDGAISAVDGTTPAYSSRKRMEELLMSTATLGQGVVDSMAKPTKDSFLFTTPPEFKGFPHGPISTPSESDGQSPGGY